jgi:hypothetical protein
MSARVLIGSRNDAKTGLGRLALSLLVALLLTSTVAYAAPPSSARPFRVLDRNSRLVGYTVTENLVAREINDHWVSFYVHTGLGIFDSEAIYVYFATTDCNGTRYIPHYSMFAEGTRVGDLLFYPTGQEVLTPLSLRVAYSGGQEGPCQAVPEVRGVYGVVATVSIDSFGLTLPFKAVQ